MGRRTRRYPNQLMAYIHKKIGHNKTDRFSLDVKTTNAAMRNLSSVAFKMYIYLCENPDNTNILLSGSRFSKTSGANDRSYSIAKQELLKKHYLILREDGDYDFYNYPYYAPTEQDLIIAEIIAKDKEKNSD